MVTLVAILAIVTIGYMANTFPTSLNNWDDGDVIESNWADALEAEIGIDNSAVTTSLNYQVTSASSVDPGHLHTTAGIQDGSLQEMDLKVVDSPSDEECLTYETTIGDFEWQTCAPVTGDWTGTFDGLEGSAYAKTGMNGAWQVLFTNALTPTSSAAGIFVKASSTFDSTLRINGNATTTGSLNVGNPVSFDGAAGIINVEKGIRIHSTSSQAGLWIQKNDTSGYLITGVSKSESTNVVDIALNPDAVSSAYVMALLANTPVTGGVLNLDNWGTGNSILVQNSNTANTYFKIDNAGHTVVGNSFANNYGFTVSTSTVINATTTLDSTDNLIVVNTNENTIGFGTTSPQRAWEFSNNGPTIRIVDANAATLAAATPYIEFGKGSGGWTRGAYIGISSSADADFDIINETSGGHIQLDSGTNSSVRIDELQATTTKGDILIVANATTTHFAITTLGSGGGDLKVAADGSIYEGSDSTGGGGSEAAWEKYTGLASPANIITPTTTNASIYVSGNATTTGSLYVGTNRLVVLESGNVGIGTTGPTQKLDVRGMVFASSTTEQLRIGNGTTDSSNYASFAVLNTGQLLINSNTATTTTFQDSIRIEGNATTTGSLTFQSYQNCNLDTDANGLLVCGSDATGGGTSTTTFDVVVDGSVYVKTDAGIEAAIADLPAGGGTVYLPAGTYSLTGDIDIGTANTTLMGSGTTTILSLGNTVNQNVITVAAVANVVIKNLTINGNRANNTSGNGISVGVGASHFTADSISIYNTDGAGIFVNGTTYPIVKNSRFAGIGQVGDTGSSGVQFYNSPFGKIADNTFDWCESDCIYLAGDGTANDGTHDYTITGNHIYNTQENQGSAIMVYEATRGVIANNEIYNTKTNTNGVNGIFVRAVGGNDDYAFATIMNNTVASTSGVGIETQSKNINVIGNIIYNQLNGSDTHGIYIAGDNSSIIGNSIASTTGHLIQINSGRKNIVIEGNALVNNLASGKSCFSINTASAVDNVVFANNTCADYQDTPTTGYGILGAGGGAFTNFHIYGNTFKNIVTANISGMADSTFGGWQNYGVATSTLAAWFGSAGTANNVDLSGGDLYVQDDLEVDGTLFTAGITGTGVNDFGGSTSFEITNAAAPVTDAAGELAYDLTSGNLILASSTAETGFVVASATTTLYSFLIPSTSVDFLSGGIIDLPGHPLKQIITDILCHVDGGTSKTFFISDGTNDTNTVACTTTRNQYDITANNVFNPYEAIRLEVGATSGDVDYLIIRILGYRISD